MTDRARPTRGNPGGSQTVLVLGAGYAGIMTANGVRAALRPDEAAVERERRRPGSYVVPPGPRPQRARAGA